MTTKEILADLERLKQDRERSKSQIKGVISVLHKPGNIVLSTLSPEAVQAIERLERILGES